MHLKEIHVKMQESAITSKGQTTLPKAVRAALGVGPGDRVRYLIGENGEVRILRARPVKRLAGLLKEGRAVVTLDEMDAAIASGAAGE